MSFRNELIIELGELEALTIYYNKLYGRYYRKGLLLDKKGKLLRRRMQENSIRKRIVKSLISNSA